MGSSGRALRPPSPSPSPSVCPGFAGPRRSAIGADELAVGAPGLGVVVVLEAGAGSLAEGRLIQGSGGRFGQSIGCGAGLLVIGAPLEGDGQRGAVYAVEAGSDTLVSLGSGETDGAELGAAVLVEVDGAVLAGAPGHAGGAGLVVQLR